MPVSETSKLMAGIRSKDLSCKNKLGYPRLFASLSQQWAKATLLDTCDGTTTLHNAQQAAMWKQTVWPKLPSNKWEKDQPSKHDDALITLLWDQLAKVDYFSPLLWRVDVYGNVLYRFADAGTPLSWSVDHLFPVARGGLRKAANMRIVQCQAHLNKADRLEFLLTRDMVCTGLSMLDFKLQVKHSVENLLSRYGKQATALPVQPSAPRGATLDRQHPSKSRSTAQRAQHAQQHGAGSTIEDVPLGLKATRVAHAAAVSSRVFSPSMRSPLSGQVRPNALPSRHELDDTLGFVQQQGSFHSEHAIQHLMTDQPLHEPRPCRLSRHSSHPSQRSLRQQNSVDPYQRHSSMPRQSSQTEASEHQSQHSYMSEPGHFSKHPQFQESQGSSSQRPPLGNSQIIASSALFQTTPVSPRNGYARSDHYEHPDHGPHGPLPAVVATQHSHNRHQQSHDYDQVPHGAPHGQSADSATHVNRPDSCYSGRHSEHGNQSEQLHQLSAPAAAADRMPVDPFQSADSFNSDMLSSDNNETQQWDNSMLAHIQEGSEHQASASQQDTRAQDELTSGALQSADSFASNALSTDMTQTQQWGKGMLSELHQVAEDGIQRSLGGKAHARPLEPALHAVLGTTEAEGMHPPTHQAGDGPHDWLWLPDELSTINDSDLSSFDASRPDIHSWLAQQQASRLPQHAQHDSPSFKSYSQLRQAASPTTLLHTADSLDSTCDERPRAHGSLSWAENAPSLTANLPRPSDITYDGLLSHRQAPVLRSTTFPPQSASPFAHWSSTPIFGAHMQPDQVQASTSNFEPQQQQQQQQQALPVVPLQSDTLQDNAYSLAEAGVKQQELDSRLAALDTLDILGEGDIFEGFGSPLQTRQNGQAQPDVFESQLYNTAAPLPVDGPGATLSAPEEALLASMREMLHDQLQGAASHQQTGQQYLSASDSYQIAPRPDLPAEQSSAEPADDITFHAPAAARPSYTPKAAPNSPDTFAPTTPDHMPDLPPCKLNPISDFQTMHHSQDAPPSRAAMSSFQQLLASQDVDKQERLSKFQQLLASQDLDQDGAPLSGLAGRVQSMAAQLNALQKRTQELQLASSPSRRVSSPFRSRCGASGRITPGSPQSLAASSPTAHQARAEPSSPASMQGRAATTSPVSPEGGVLDGRALDRSLSPRVARISERFSPSSHTGY